MATSKPTPAAQLEPAGITRDEADPLFEAPDRWSMADVLILAALVTGIALMAAGVWCDPLSPITTLIG
ncbi:hypothetical protein [Aliidongia dinghuensis]|uniref:hypothetical protein n=1 Tax=Aliidongia dinghuensis TaxID=1867774 RepID=UPI00166BE2F4|nr:hypothetical protein [Aliidongia dinghuensis]